jgi:hypothetical protein
VASTLRAAAQSSEELPDSFMQPDEKELLQSLRNSTSRIFEEEWVSKALDARNRFLLSQDAVVQVSSALKKQIAGSDGQHGSSVTADLAAERDAKWSMHFTASTELNNAYPEHFLTLVGRVSTDLSKEALLRLQNTIEAMDGIYQGLLVLCP